MESQVTTLTHENRRTVSASRVTGCGCVRGDGTGLALSGVSRPCSKMRCLDVDQDSCGSAHRHSEWSSGTFCLADGQEIGERMARWALQPQQTSKTKPCGEKKMWSLSDPLSKPVGCIQDPISAHVYVEMGDVKKA